MSTLKNTPPTALCNDSTPLLHFPFLCAESLPEQTATRALFFCPGLTDSPADCRAGTSWRPATLPFSPKTAAALSRELAEQAKLIAGQTNVLHGATGTGQFERPADPFALSGDELDALRRFAEEEAPLPVQANPAGQRLENAQKTLLLALHREQQWLEACELARAFTSARAALHDILGADAPDEDYARDPAISLPFAPELPDIDEILPLRGWERVLNAMYVFAPDAIFLVTHADIRAQLEERGITFRQNQTGELEATPPLAQALGHSAENSAAPEATIRLRLAVPHDI